MAADESHDEALPKTAHADSRCWLVSPLYHGNAAETDLKPVCGIELNAEGSLFPIAVKFALVPVGQAKTDGI